MLILRSILFCRLFHFFQNEKFGAVSTKLHEPVGLVLVKELSVLWRKPRLDRTLLAQLRSQGLGYKKIVRFWLRQSRQWLMPLKDWSEKVDNLISNLLLVIGLMLGSGLSVKWHHDEGRLITIKKLMEPQPSLLAFTQKMTRK
jgi:hypothetical protein